MTGTKGVSTAPAVRAPEASLGFSLNFLSGRGLLTLKERPFGPFEVKLLELEIPDISFPFDVTGGADRFKSKRCVLRHLVFDISAEGLAQTVRDSPLVDFGFVELKSAIRDGFVEFAGRFAVGDHRADFTFRAALLLQSRSEVSVVFYDTRVYGWLPVPSALLPAYLRRALAVPFATDERGGIWHLKPLDQFLRFALPRNGWKIPDSTQAGLVGAQCARNRIIIVAGPEGEPDTKQLKEREPDSRAVLAAEGVANNRAAEEALAQGRIHEAYDHFRDTLYDERGGPWARQRLLQIGAADPELTLETRNLAEEVLARDGKNVQALLAVAAIAMREGSFGDATARYGALAEIARNERQRFDAIAAELAAAAAATPIDPGGALAAYERAAARARDSVVAHQALLDLRSAQGDWEGAVQAGERLVKLEPDSNKKSGIHRKLGHICRSQVADLKRARMHFERALRLTPDDPEALEGLAETYAARGEPARAASYIARLAEQAEHSGDQKRIAGLNLRLGEIWERWLGDAETAATRYHRVLDADPKNRTAQLRLAELAEARGDLSEARGYYEDVLAVEEESGGDAEAIPDLVSAYTRLARVTLSSEGLSSEAVACLERAVELDPANRTARDELARLLRERGEWGRLMTLLDEWTRAATDPDEIRRANLHAARVQLEQRRDKPVARQHLEKVLNVAPYDAEALELILPILEEQRDTVALTQRLAAAADATAEPIRRADFLYQLAMARASLGLALDVRLAPLESALDANPYHRDASREAVKLLRESNDFERLADGLERAAVAAPAREQKVNALLERAGILAVKLDRLGAAEQVLREALALAPEHTQGWLELADLQRQQGDNKGARESLASALTDERLPAEAHGVIHRRLAELARSDNDAEAEITHLKASIRAGSPAVDEELSARLLEVLKTLGRREELADLLEEWAAAGRDAESDRLWLEAAEIRCDLGELDRAQSIYEQLSAKGGAIALSAALALEKLALGRDDFARVAHALEVQLSASDAEQQPAIFERLIDAQVLRDDEVEAERACFRLLELAPGNAKARRFLAERAQAAHHFDVALEHLAALLLKGDPGVELATRRRGSFVHAAAIAREIRPDLVAELQGRFDAEFPGALDDALVTPLGRILAADGHWEELLALRRFQLERDPKNLGHRREVADILHEKLDRSKEAAAHYEQVLKTEPENLEVQLPLLAIYEQTGRFRDLGELLFTMSNQAEEVGTVLAYGLRSAEVFTEQVQDLALAQRSLRALSERPDIDPDEARLLAALRAAEMYAQVASLGERSLDERPDVADGRFTHLIALYTGPLEKPAAAAAWCRRMGEVFADSDIPWRMWADTLVRYPATGDVLGVLQDWADTREGQSRAAILLELVTQAQKAGDEERALAALVDAAEADPGSREVLTQLVESYRVRKDWRRTLAWLDRLAGLYPVGEARDAYLRKLVAIAMGEGDDHAAAARALEQLSGPSSAETAQLGHLYIEQRDFARLAEHESVAALLDNDTLVVAASGLASQGFFAPAQHYFQRAFRDHLAQPQIWDLATEAWKAGDRVAELGRWRVAWSRNEDAVNPIGLRLRGYLELVAAGEARDAAKHGVDLEVDFAAANLEDVAHASLVFAAANAAGELVAATWLHAAARALEKLLPEDAAELPEVLGLRFAHELASGSADTAVEIAQRMLDRGDDGAADRLEDAYAAAGRIDDLLSHLTARAERGGDRAPQLWMRIAEIFTEREAWPDAAKALPAVPAAVRPLRWGELRYEGGVALDDPVLQIEGAELIAELIEGDTSKARWLRTAARIRWWRLGDEEAARALLGRAQELVPITVDAVDGDAQLKIAAGEDSEARRELEEGLAVLAGPETVGLWVELGDLCIKYGDQEAGLTAVEQAMNIGSNDTALWARLAEQGRSLERKDLAQRAYGEAFAIDTGFEPQYAAALEANETWELLITVLQSRGEQLKKDEAASRFERAAKVARDQLGDKKRAVKLLGMAIGTAPTVENLLTAFALGVDLDKPKLLAQVGPPLLARLTDDATERPGVLRQTVDALTALEQRDATYEYRQELVHRQIATAFDKLELGRMERKKDPAAAAALLTEAAAGSTPEERPELLFEAALCWHGIDALDKARPLVEEAITGGIDTASAHELAFALLTGEARLHSAARLVALDGDAAWEEPRRAALRFELAEALVGKGQPDAAHTLLIGAREHGKPAGWALVMESVLRALSRSEELADLWLVEAQAGDCPWADLELLPRVRGALKVYVATGNEEGEQRALVFSTVLGPRILAALAAEAPGRDDVLRYTVDVLDKLGRTAETEAQRRELVARGAATALDKLALGRMDRSRDPAAAAALLAEAAREVPAEQRPPILFEAALTWHEANNDDEARPLVDAAITEGVDTAAAHALAHELLDGPARLRSADRLLALGGDDDWETDRRAALRLELAGARLEENAAEAAHELLSAARALGKPPAWAKTMERALRKLKRHQELAELWITEGQADDCPWTDIELLERANEALNIFSMFGQPEGETRALDLLTVVGPRLLRQLGADDAIRADVLRHTVDALDKLGRPAQTHGLRTELVERGAATGFDKLQLGRMERQRDPAAAAELLAQAAAESTEQERSPLLFEAALAWHDAGKDEVSAPLVREAIAGGIDTVEAHRLAFELGPELMGNDRLRSAARLIALDGDADWEENRRAALRFDLARARLAEGQAEAAHELLAAARSFGKPPGWAVTMEAILQELKRNEELALLWMTEGRADDCPWADADLLPRVREAQEVFGLVADETREREALDFIAVLGPRLLTQVPAEDPRRVEVLRVTVDAFDRLERTPESLGLRRELVEHGAATAEDKLQLGRLERAQNPAASGHMLAEAANEGPPEQRAELLFEAALAWHDAGEDIRAAPLVREAVVGGVDTVPAHALAFAILAGEDRLVSAARLIELAGDADWAPEERAAIRFELAQARLHQGMAEEAHDLLTAARGFAKPPGWARVMEAVVQALGQRVELADLWMNEGQAADRPWPDTELIRRIAEALSIYLEAGNDQGANRALEVITQVGPRLLETLAADDQQRPKVLRWTVDAFDRLDRTDQTAALRHELVARGIATALDKLSLGRLERGRNPAISGALLTQSAYEGPPEQRGEVLFEAALALHEAEEDHKAAPLIREAIMGGVETAAAHELAYDILEGSDRIRSAVRLLELEGDAKWDTERRALLRQVLAQARLEFGESEAAHGLLIEARTFAKPPGWTLLMESVLSSLARNDELANLWMTEGQAEDNPWSGDDLESRIREAAEVFSRAQDSGSELQALELLTRLMPEDTQVRDRLAEVAATLGDSDKFLQQVSIQLERAADAAARSILALRYAPILESQFEEPEAAVKMLRDVFENGPTLDLADALTKSMVPAATSDLVEILSGGAENADVPPGDSAGLLVRAARVAADSLGNSGLAFKLFHRALYKDAGNREAQAFCLEHAETQERWDEAIEILEVAASADDERAHELLTKAADMARDKLEDPGRELSIIKSASEISPQDEATSTRLLELQLARHDLSGVKETLLSGKVPGRRQVVVAVRLADALGAAEGDAEKNRVEAEAVMEWMVEKHPHSLAASDYRLQKARDRGDNQALLQELKDRLNHPATFDDGEKAGFNAEAGRAALSLGDRSAALEHFVAVLDSGELTADSLFHAIQIARENEAEKEIDLLLAHAARIRDQIAAAADEAPAELRMEWLSLLGVAHERAGDIAKAVEAHAAVVAAVDEAPPRASVEFLRRGYEAQADWQALVELNTKVAKFAAEAPERAQLFYEVGLLWRDKLDDVARAGEAFAACLEADPEHADGQLAYGLQLSHLGEHERALPLLVSQSSTLFPDVDSFATPTGALLAFAETLRHTESWERGVEVLERILIREPDRTPLHRERAEMLEAIERMDEADAEWRAYADALGPDGSPEELAPIRQRLAESAATREDFDEAVTQLCEAHRLMPEAMDIVVQLRLLYERTRQWREVVELRLREAAAARSAAEQIAQYKELARIYRHEQGDFAGSALMLERALSAAPDDIELLRELLITHEHAGDFTKFLVVAERILTVVPESDLDVDFFARLARAYEEAAGDANLAKEFYGKAAQLDPTNRALKDKHRELAKVCGDFAEFAAAEEEAIAAQDDVDEKVARYQELAEVYLRHLSDLAGATGALANAVALRPEDLTLLRQLADTYSLDEAGYQNAAHVYNMLLILDPLNPEVIRIRARLAGQMADTDRAYGCYAALLTLLPWDDEAREYVNACRGARPPGPLRAITDEDRARGLIHPDQSGPVEELYAPLARFAELTRPGDLAGRGITESDRIPPEDPRSAWLAHVLVPLGLPEVDLFVWRGGGFACEAEFLGAPTLLLGTSLVESPDDRARAFVVAREAELYRTGHSLCARLSEFELGGLLAAVCVAIDPTAEPPNATFETVEWAGTIAAPMTDEIRAQLRPQVLAYLAPALDPEHPIDIGAWREGCMSTAARVALLECCDIGEGIETLMRARGFEDITDDQRIAVIRESPEDLDLFRFALSDTYFELRQTLGLALRPQG